MTTRDDHENRAMRTALAIMGFDVDKLIRFMGDNSDSYWRMATFKSVCVDLVTARADAEGINSNTFAALETLFNGFCKLESTHV